MQVPKRIQSIIDSIGMLVRMVDPEIATNMGRGMIQAMWALIMQQGKDSDLTADQWNDLIDAVAAELSKAVPKDYFDTIYIKRQENRSFLQIEINRMYKGVPRLTRKLTGHWKIIDKHPVFVDDDNREWTFASFLPSGTKFHQRVTVCGVFTNEVKEDENAQEEKE